MRFWRDGSPPTWQACFYEGDAESKPLRDWVFREDKKLIEAAAKGRLERLTAAEDSSVRLKRVEGANRRTRMELRHHRILSSEYLRALRDLYPIVGFTWIKPGPFHRPQTARFQ